MLNPNDPAAYQWPPLDQHPDFVPRFITGIDAAIDPEDLKPSPMVIWQIPEPMTVESRWIDPEVLEILFGQPVVPLCCRQLPAKGTE